MEPISPNDLKTIFRSKRANISNLKLPTHKTKPTHQKGRRTAGTVQAGGPPGWEMRAKDARQTVQALEVLAAMRAAA